MDLSVIIPVYNSSKTILESIQSVVSECLGSPYSWELLIIDDGSTDNSRQLIEQYIIEFSYGNKIELISQDNFGAAVARNIGLRRAKGEYIAFNDSDDRWIKGKLQLQMKYFKANPEVVLLTGIFGFDNIESIKKIDQEMLITINDQVLKNYISPPTAMIRTSILDKSGLFCENMRYSEEGYFFNNIVYSGKTIFLKEILAESITEKRRWGDSGLSGNLFEMEKGELFNIKMAYNNKYIGLKLFAFAYIFSIFKFFRRCLISKFMK